ncbi:DUF3011 domain-containing protein [Trichormus variabilis ARAD]|uniref:DUF3011 domain-containing protein n=2 Tax=Nostocales TaxID=1161 RepID=A0ABR6SBI3_ANAVA|nr:DUF3011 domain-containing protein [Trichormus variabilis ARAD]MBC1258277.1 DUF3011 domain-containing protein [Trichormus variabilis V5]MBC1269000.1 DUF3011 domain-containing protein [Trichormus variabilis FSR]MBC1303639.1 DUF3011 domain-containing protein [Trichormus variabilis N2B]MBC1314028.1 DUF3011 domain-containing protein [Trichormus variabilis PNB]MBC1329420.1 DUF3011 domain-containing protein [Trichormus variabilis 9RC]MBD2378735.1 DUF3011 domain-containing protein [Trichormus vari
MAFRLPVIATAFMVTSISIGAMLSVAPPASAQQIITCESQNNRRNVCIAPSTGRVRLVRQLSNASCRGNWGQNRNRIWVRNGCRAEFSTANSRYGRGGRYNRDTRYNRDRDSRYNRDDRYNRW